jgi:Uma2 family endonuclease
MASVIVDKETGRVIPPGTDLSEILYEVVGSDHVEKPPMGAYEYELACILHEILAPFVRSHRLGRGLIEVPFDLRPAVDRTRRPDVAYISAARWPLDRRAPRGVEAWPVVPDLVVEIVSPTNTMNEIMERVEEYFTAGSRRVWVVLPDTMKVYDYSSPNTPHVLAVGGVIEGGELLPGFRLPLVDLFGVAPGEVARPAVQPPEPGEPER